MDTATIDQERLDQLVGQLVGELGATLNAALVVIGDRRSACTGRWRRRGR